MEHNAVQLQEQPNPLPSDELVVKGRDKIENTIKNVNDIPTRVTALDKWKDALSKVIHGTYMNQELLEKEEKLAPAFEREVQWDMIVQKLYELQNGAAQTYEERYVNMRASTSVPHKELAFAFYKKNTLNVAVEAGKTAMGIITKIAQFGVDRLQNPMDDTSRDTINYTINRLMVSLSSEENMIYGENQPNEGEPNTLVAFIKANKPSANRRTCYCYYKQGQ